MKVLLSSVSRHQAESDCSETRADEEIPDDVFFRSAETFVESTNPDQFLFEAEFLPKALLDLPGLTSHRSFDEIEFERWMKGQKLASKLFAVGNDAVAAKLRDCHNERTTKICCGCSKRTVFWNRCDLFYCPQCAPRLATKRLKELWFWVERIKQPKHLVLTLKNVPSLTPRFVSAAKKSLARFRRTKIFSGCRGGFWAMEITNKGKGWHVHFHLVVDSPWMDVRVISEKWKMCNGGAGEVVWIEDANKGGLRMNLPRYVTKYCGKGFDISEWNEFDLGDFVSAVSGGRTFGVFGNLLGQRGEWQEFLKRSKAERRKCECGCSEFKYFSDNELRVFDSGGFWKLENIPAARAPSARQFCWRFGIEK